MVDNNIITDTSTREKFINAIKRKSGDYIPFDFDLCPSLYEVFKSKTGHDNYKDYFKMPLRFVHAPTNIKTEDNFHFSKYYKIIEPEVTYSEWGIGIKQGSVEHFVQMLHPMENLTLLKEFEDYPYPDPIKDHNWDIIPQRIKNLKDKDTIVFASMGATIFELAWVLRSMEELMIDMLENKELANFLFDRILEFKFIFLENYIKSGVDGIQFGDDVGTQIDMMMSVDMWREFLKPRLKALIDHAKKLNPNIIIEYHSDGNIEKIIPELIEIGVEILNPVQPECMNPYELKKLYGNKLSFRGCLGTQTVMPFGSCEDVERTCMKLMEEVGAGGGLILSPSHVLEPEVPWENIQTLVDSIKKYNDKV